MEYVTLKIWLDSDESTIYEFGEDIDILEFCNNNTIYKFEDFSWKDVKKLVQTNFDIKFETDPDIKYSYDIKRDLYGQFIIEINAMFFGRYNRNKFQTFERRLKINSFLKSI